jgi:hypothetical protein
VRAALVRRPLALGDERSVGNADCGKIEHRAEMKRQARTAWVVPTGGVDQERVRRVRKGAHRRLEELAFA